ncbi:hypothetical protein ACA910_021186 [Epithemia clementina (nom. ined.)]
MKSWWTSKNKPLPSVAFFNHLLEKEEEEEHTERQDDSSDPHDNKDDDNNDKSRRFSSAPLSQLSSWDHACDTERRTNVAPRRQQG